MSESNMVDRTRASDSRSGPSDGSRRVLRPSRRVARLLSVAVVAVLVVALSACDTTQYGQTAESVSYRYYNYNSIIVHDGALTNFDSCGIGITTTGAAIFWAAVTPPPADVAVLVGGIIITGIGAAATLSDCVGSWVAAARNDANSRWIFTCSNDLQLTNDRLTPVVALSDCIFMGWVAKAIDLTLAIVDNVAREVTGCKTLIEVPVGIRLCIN